MRYISYIRNGQPLGRISKFEDLNSSDLIEVRFSELSKEETEKLPDFSRWPLTDNVVFQGLL